MDFTVELLFILSLCKAEKANTAERGWDEKVGFPRSSSLAIELDFLMCKISLV